MRNGERQFVEFLDYFTPQTAFYPVAAAINGVEVCLFHDTFQIGDAGIIVVHTLAAIVRCEHAELDVIRLAGIDVAQYSYDVILKLFRKIVF